MTVRNCVICKEPFRVRGNAKTCSKKCSRQRQDRLHAKWQLDNREDILEYGRKRYAANPEKARETRRKRYAANPENEREASRKWRVANPEKVRELGRKWSAANPEKVRESRLKLDPEKARERMRRWAAANPERRRVNELKSRKNRSIRCALRSTLTLQMENGLCPNL